MRAKRLRVGGVVLVVAAVLAACGSTGSSSGSSSGSTSSAAASTGNASATASSSAGASLYGATPAIALPHVPGLVETPKTVGGNVSINVGLTKPLTFKKGAKLRIAEFVTYGAVPYFKVAEHGAAAAAARFGYQVTVYNSNASATTEQQQIQAAINSHNYNAFLFIPQDNSVCDLATQTAAAAGILVAVYGTNCGSGSAADNQFWSPGTLNFSGGATGGYDNELAVAQKIVAEYPGKQDAVLINGPTGNDGVTAITDAFKTVTATHPDFHMTYMYNAWDPSGGLADTNAWLTSNPRTTLIVCYSPDGAPGCVAAMQSHGLKPGQIPLYVNTGQASVVTLMKQGWVFATSPQYPGSVAAAAVRSLHDAVNGLPVPRVILNDGNPLTPYTSTTPPYLTWVTPALVKSGQYAAQN